MWERCPERKGKKNMLNGSPCTAVILVTGGTSVLPYGMVQSINVCSKLSLEYLLSKLHDLSNAPPSLLPQRTAGIGQS